MGVWGYAPEKKFKKSPLKSRIFRHFLQAEIVSSAVAARQDYTIGTTKMVQIKRHLLH